MNARAYVPVFSRCRRMQPTDFRRILDASGISQADFARLLGKTDRSVSRWVTGAQPIPIDVVVVLGLLDAGTVTIDDIRKAKEA